MKLCILLQNHKKFSELPTLSQWHTWLLAAKSAVPAKFTQHKKTITIRFVDKVESAWLNSHYRHKTGPTNILSFPDEIIPGVTSDAFGDLAICVPLVREEAALQHKTVEAHFAHLAIHGFLHLLGYDHIKKKEAEYMEALEIALLTTLGYPNPYGDQ